VSFWSELDAVRERWDVLRHPFYQRWSAGELTVEELGLYAGEYHHAVVALAAASERAASAATEPALRDELAGHAAEERAHVDVWAGFAAAVGGDTARPPAPETAACAEAWAGPGRRSLMGTLVALYAIESAQPAIAATKADGLRRWYGIGEGDGTAYFDLHAERDLEHAAAGRRLIEQRLAGSDEQALLAEAEAVLRGNWELLDGVERACGREVAVA